MVIVEKICLIGILILALCCFVEEYASFYYKFEAEKSKFRMIVFLVIALLSAVLCADYFILK